MLADPWRNIQMDHPDTAFVVEVICWAIAIFCSTTALFLAAVDPLPTARNRTNRQLRNQHFAATHARCTVPPARRRRTA